MTQIAEGSDYEIIVQYRNSPGVGEKAAANRKTLMTALDAFIAGDAESFWAIFDPDVTFHEAACLPYGGAHSGLEATKKAYGRMTDTFAGMRAAFEQVLAAGDIVILYQTITFRVRANGNTGSLPVAELFRFRDGKVVEWRAHYFDSDMVAKAIAG